MEGEIDAPAAVGAGQNVLPFEARTTAGTTVKFPGDYQGKVVLLDFWATWCGPCVREIPNVTAAFEKYHSQSFEILSVSLDKEDAAAKLAAFTKENKMPWPEIYDGKYWKAAIAVQYNIQSIPHAFLVDGDTGKVIADGDSIRGDGVCSGDNDARIDGRLGSASVVCFRAGGGPNAVNDCQISGPRGVDFGDDAREPHTLVLGKIGVYLLRRAF